MMFADAKAKASGSLAERVLRARASLARGLGALSRNLSVVAVLACFTLPLLPHVAAPVIPTSVAPAPAAPPALEAAAPPPVPVQPAPATKPEPARPEPRQVEIVRARPLAALDPAPGPQPEPESSLPARDAAGKLQAKRAVPPQPQAPSAAAREEPKPEAPAPAAAWSEAEVTAALKACVQLLGPAAAEVEPLPPVKQDQCGAAAPVLLKRIGSGSNAVEVQPPAALNCAMVAKLATWVDRTLQPIARETLAASVGRLNGVSGYVCRGRNGDLTSSGKLSEHALANAIDITSFTLSDGRLVDVGKHWGPTRRDKGPAEAGKAALQPAAQRKFAVKPGSAHAIAAPAAPSPAKDQPVEPEARFLRRLHDGACTLFGTVLGPEANEAHREHFHFDLYPRKSSAFCQ